MNNQKGLIMLGGGGHANVLADILLHQGANIVAVVSHSPPAEGSILDGIKHHTNDDDVLLYSTDDVELVNGIGFLPGSQLRRKLYQHFKNHQYAFKSVISDAALISKSAKFHEGVQIMHGCIVQTGACIKINSIINTRAVIEHDTCIGEHNHIAPGAILCGGISTGSHVFIGAGATVIHGIDINDDAVISAGAIVIKNVADQGHVNPCR